LTSDPDNMSLHDYLFLFSGAIMGPTGLFCIANVNEMNFFKITINFFINDEK
jgi:hypothetical protein